MNNIFKNHFSNEDIPLLMNTISILKSDWELGMQLLVGQSYYNPLIKVLREYYTHFLNDIVSDKILLLYAIGDVNIKDILPTQFRTLPTENNEGNKIWLPLFATKFDLCVRRKNTIIANSLDVCYPIHLYTTQKWGEIKGLQPTVYKLSYGSRSHCDSDGELDVLHCLLSNQSIKSLYLYKLLWGIPLDYELDLSNYNHITFIEAANLSINSKLPSSLEKLKIGYRFQMLEYNKPFITNLLEQCPKLEYIDAPTDENAHKYLLEQGFVETNKCEYYKK